MSDESIKPPSMSNKMLNPSLNYVGTKARVTFNGDCLKQEKISFDHGKVLNIYIVYEIDRSADISSYPMLENCLVQLNEQNMLILVCINILDMVLDLIEKHFFQLLKKLVEMYNFWSRH